MSECATSPAPGEVPGSLVPSGAPTPIPGPWPPGAEDTDHTAPGAGAPGRGPPPHPPPPANSQPRTQRRAKAGGREGGERGARRGAGVSCAETDRQSRTPGASDPQPSRPGTDALLTRQAWANFDGAGGNAPIATVSLPVPGHPAFARRFEMPRIPLQKHTHILRGANSGGSSVEETTLGSTGLRVGHHGATMKKAKTRNARETGALVVEHRSIKLVLKAFVPGVRRAPTHSPFAL